MLTNPSTLGLFDEGIEEVARIFHERGALLYYDGANLNAVVGALAPGRHGLRHRPLQPPQDVLAAARRRWAGRRPRRGRARSSSRSCPRPPSCATATRFRLDHDRPKSIGRVRGFAGPFGVFVRSYAFMRAYGPALTDMSEVAVLNANYLLARLRDAYDLPYDRHCMHEFVLSARTLKREHGITALDVAKRLMDHGIHPPTIYFPLVVQEALMIEPTETETKERLDEFVDAMRSIAAEAANRARDAKQAPLTPAGPAARRGEGREAARRPLRVRRGRVRPIGSRPDDDRRRPRARRALPRSRPSGLRARRRAARAAARLGVHAPGRGGAARPRGVPAAAAGPYEIDEFSYEEIDPEIYGNTAVLVSRYSQVARLDGRDLTPPHERDGHLDAARRSLADRPSPRDARRRLTACNTLSRASVS